MNVAGHIALLIGIDDTDNAHSRGTGFLSRKLAHELEANNLARVSGITRHQLYVHPDIPYTSQNSSACIAVGTRIAGKLREHCAAFLRKENAPGSDAGLCIAAADHVHTEIRDWGKLAKDTVLRMDRAYQLAEEHAIYLEGFSGTRCGVIGALAAVGLRAEGNDGRFIWRKGMKELRELEPGIRQISDLRSILELDAIQTLDGSIPDDRDSIFVNDWVRPLLLNHQAILIAEKEKHDEDYEWKLTSKETIRSIS